MSPQNHRSNMARQASPSAQLVAAMFILLVLPRRSLNQCNSLSLGLSTSGRQRTCQNILKNTQCKLNYQVNWYAIFENWDTSCEKGFLKIDSCFNLHALVEFRNSIVEEFRDWRHSNAQESENDEHQICGGPANCCVCHKPVPVRKVADTFRYRCSTFDLVLELPFNLKQLGKRRDDDNTNCLADFASQQHDWNSNYEPVHAL